jgi:hypothetical protein
MSSNLKPGDLVRWIDAPHSSPERQGTLDIAIMVGLDRDGDGPYVSLLSDAAKNTIFGCPRWWPSRFEKVEQI